MNTNDLKDIVCKLASNKSALECKIKEKDRSAFEYGFIKGFEAGKQFSEEDRREVIDYIKWELDMYEL